MHKTPSGELRKSLRASANEMKRELVHQLKSMPVGCGSGNMTDVDIVLEKMKLIDAEIRKLDPKMRLEDLNIWEMRKTQNGKTFAYWMATWRENGRVRNVHLGSCRKMDAHEALEKARLIKAESLRRYDQNRIDSK